MCITVLATAQRMRHNVERRSSRPSPRYGERIAQRTAWRVSPRMASPATNSPLGLTAHAFPFLPLLGGLRDRSSLPRQRNAVDFRLCGSSRNPAAPPALLAANACEFSERSSVERICPVVTSTLQRTLLKTF